jgi:hypothetical protein
MSTEPIPRAVDVTTHLLACLAEECAEVSQQAAKAIRFGLEQIEPGQLLSNGARIVFEILDLFAVAEMLHEAGAFDMKRGDNKRRIEAKKRKVEKFMRYAESIGTLDRGVTHDN